MTAYTGPAGVILSRDDMTRIHRALLHSNDEADRLLRQRVKQYMDDTWNDPTRTQGQSWSTPNQPNSNPHS